MKTFKQIRKVSEGPLVISKYGGVEILAKDLELLMHKDDRIIKMVAKILKKKVQLDRAKMTITKK